jgi:hypothetical protein
MQYDRLLWKCNKLIVTQQELLRYYGNAIWCIDHVAIGSASGDLSRTEWDSSHTYIHIHTHTYIHIHTHTYIHTHIHTYIYTNTRGK